jgi:hypothetical protein
MVAICSMVKKPFNFDTWIEYHLSLGVNYIFLRVEDTPELKELTDRYSNIYANFIENKDDTFSQMDRQAKFIESVKDQMINLNINWVIHIDSDELFCVNDLDIFDEIDEKVNVLHFSNYEAIYQSDDLSNPFLQTNKFKVMNKISYGNGKSAARVNKNLEPINAHYFKGEEIEISPKKAVILHFESPTFELWYEKFKNKKWVGSVNLSNDSLDKIPFEFYKESIEVIKSGDKEKAREYYNQMKVNVNDPVIKLYWTPQLESKNINWVK